MWDLIASLGLILTLVGLVAVIRPMPSLKIPTRGRGVIVGFVGFVLLAVGAVQDQAGNLSPRDSADGALAESQASDDSEGATVSPAVAAPAATETAPAPTPRAPQWTEVASWRGSGIKETESFVTVNREWRIRWQSANEPFANAGILQLFVHNEAGQMVSLAANKQGPGQDVSYVRAPPGRYYLKINSANIDWNVTVEEQR